MLSLETLEANELNWVLGGLVSEAALICLLHSSTQLRVIVWDEFELESTYAKLEYHTNPCLPTRRRLDAIHCRLTPGKRGT